MAVKSLEKISRSKKRKAHLCIEERHTLAVRQSNSMSSVFVKLYFSCTERKKNCFKDWSFERVVCKCIRSAPTKLVLVRRVCGKVTDPPEEVAHHHLDSNLVASCPFSIFNIPPPPPFTYVKCCVMVGSYKRDRTTCITTGFRTSETMSVIKVDA